MTQTHAINDIALVERVKEYVKQYMSVYDASHDYNHIVRVVGLAHQILAHSPSQNYDSQIVILAALLHDVGDRKYLQPGQDSTTIVHDLLLSFGTSPALAQTIQTIVSNVSYSNEIKNPAHVLSVIAQHPELAVVQDADRLDAIGAVGIGRCFTFGGAMYGKRKAEAMNGNKNGVGNGRGLSETMDHFDEKLVLLEGMMKTEYGKLLAKERTRRLHEFMGWWEDEVDIERVGDGVLSYKP